MDKDPNRAPAPATFSTQVSIRNLKRQFMIYKFINPKNQFSNCQLAGMIIVQIMVFATIVIMLIGFSLGVISIKAGRIAFNREQAFQATEAGIDYYRWHLAHAPSDYQDGTGVAGPYVHAVKDRSGNTVGQFSLDITAPILGSTLVKIKSTGSSSLDPSYIRKIESQVAKPSIAKYSVAENNAFRFGAGTEIFGPVHVNGEFVLTVSHNIVTSGATTYTDADSDACTTTNSWGVHTCLSPADPTSPQHSLPVQMFLKLDA